MAVDPRDKLFCEIAIDLGFITQEDANQALEAQKVDSAIGQDKRVGAYLFEKNLLDKEQIGQIVKMQDRMEVSKPHQQGPNYNPPSMGVQLPSGRQRIVAVLLAFFLGGLGAHKFYLGQNGAGVMYLIFCWTFLPALIALIEGIQLLTMSDQDFNQLYGN